MERQPDKNKVPGFPASKNQCASRLPVWTKRDLRNPIGAACLGTSLADLPRARQFKQPFRVWAFGTHLSTSGATVHSGVGRNVWLTIA